jgi:hypothetical protein
VCRPLFVVDSNQLVIRKTHINELMQDNIHYNWTTLMQAGVVEYIDTEVCVRYNTFLFIIAYRRTLIYYLMMLFTTNSIVVLDLKHFYK